MKLLSLTLNLFLDKGIKKDFPSMETNKLSSLL